MKYDEPSLDTPRWPYVVGVILALIVFTLLRGA